MSKDYQALISASNRLSSACRLMSDAYDEVLWIPGQEDLTGLIDSCSNMVLKLSEMARQSAVKLDKE